MPIKGYLSIRRAAGGAAISGGAAATRIPSRGGARPCAAPRGTARQGGPAQCGQGVQPAFPQPRARSARERSGGRGRWDSCRGGCRLPGGLPACDGVRGLGGGASAGAGGRRADPRVHGGRPAASLRGWQVWVGARSPMPPRPQRGRGPDSGTRQGRTAIFLGLPRRRPRRGQQGAGRPRAA